MLDGTDATPPQAAPEGPSSPAAPLRPPAVPAGAVWSDDEREWQLGAVDGEGRRQGLLKAWRADGTPAGEAVYRAGQRHGPWRRFHPDGSLAREVMFVDDKPTGTLVAHGFAGPTPEPLQSCCVPPGAWQLQIDYAGGMTTEIRWYDQAGAHILPSGNPHPPRPASVPRAARYEERAQRWVVPHYTTEGQPDAVWYRWSTEGVLREREEYQAGKTHGLWQRFDEGGALAEESQWREGQRDGAYRRIGVPEGLYQDARVHEERGMFQGGQAVGVWSLHDRDGETLRRFDLGAAVDEATLPESPALRDVSRQPAAERTRARWEAEAETLERSGRLSEAILAAARAAAAGNNADPLRLLLARATPALTPPAALQLASDITQIADGKLALVVNTLARGGDATSLLRALASSLGGAETVSLDLVDAALLLAPLRHECHITRALVNVHLGRPEVARADVAGLPAEWAEQRDFLQAYTRAIFPAWTFGPARADIRTLFQELPESPDQPLGSVRAHVAKYATRLQTIRAALLARLAPDPAPDWMMPDLSALIPDGPVPLDRWEFEEIIQDDDAEAEAEAGAPPAPPAEPTLVKVDERLEADASYPLPTLLRMARREWNALCWLCWSAGLDRVALPETMQPPADFGKAAAMSVERTWRCRDKLTTAGLRAMTQGLPGFTWEEMEIDTMPAVLAEIATEEYVEMRALFYWLCDSGVQSPWQDNLRGND